jgi:hypothetical protein
MCQIGYMAHAARHHLVLGLQKNVVYERPGLYNPVCNFVKTALVAIVWAFSLDILPK